MKKTILLASALGVGGGLLYLLTRGSRQGAIKGVLKPATGIGKSRKASTKDRAQTQHTQAGVHEQESHVIDDHGTDQAAASDILKQIRDEAFDSSDEKLALALGRPAEEIEAWTHGSGIIDGDVIIKARGLAMQRGIQTS